MSRSGRIVRFADDLNLRWDNRLGSFGESSAQDYSDSSGDDEGPQDVADCQSHSFRTKVFKETHICRVCQDVIWNEGRSCKSCKFTCHRRCEYKVITACVSPVNYPVPRNEEPKQNTLSQRNGDESQKRKMMSPGTEITTTIKSDGPVRYTFDLDVDYITERIIAMSFPSGGPEAQYRSNLKDVVNMLKTKHQNHYVIFNLSKRRNDIIKMNEQVLDVGWHDSLAPPLERLCSICKQIETWLKKDPQNVVVLHCKGSRSPIGVVVLAYMNYINITASSETALDRYAMKRFMEVKTDSHVQPSQFRYENYFTGLLTGAISINSAPLYLHHVVIHGVPNYDANGGCRPFIRVYQGMQTVYTSGVYTVPEGTTKFVISLDKALPLRGDILVKCYHKKFRSNTRDVIFRCQFHTTAVVEYRLLFGKEDLDDACTDARFPPFTKVEFIFASTGDRLHNSDYVSHSNFPVDNTDDPLIRWDSYENFSKLVEGLDFEPESPQPNGGNNNNLSPGTPKYIYASDGSPYAQVQKTPSFNKSQQPVILQQTREPQVNQQPAPNGIRANGPQNGPHRDPNPYSSHNGPAGPSNGGVPRTREPQPSAGGKGVERTPSGRQINLKEQQELEELLRGIEDSKGLGGMEINQVPGSPQISPGVESPGNRRIVSVHAELKNAPLSVKKMSPARPIIEEEFENSPRNDTSTEQANPPISTHNRPLEQTIVPQSAPAVESSVMRGSRDSPGSPRKEPVSNASQNMLPLPNGNVLRDRVPLEHANPTYDYTETDQKVTPRTGDSGHPAVVEEPVTEVRLKASPVQLNSLESTPRMDFTSPTNSRTYQPQPLKAQQQKIKFITKYDDSFSGGQGHPHMSQGQGQPGNGPKPSGVPIDDGLQWLQRQQDKLKEQKEKDVPQYQRNENRSPYYSSPLQVQEPSFQPSYQKEVHHGAPTVRTEPLSYSPAAPFSQSGTYSPSGSVNSEPLTLNTSQSNVPDNLSWLEQQQLKLREKRQREKLQLDPSYPLQVDTSYSASQLPSQPSSVSSVRSDVSGYSNTPYSHWQPDVNFSARRGYHREPLSIGGHAEVSQPPLRKGPPTPAYGYDNMDSSSRLGGIPSHDNSLEPSSHRYHYHLSHHHYHHGPNTAPAPNQGHQRPLPQSLTRRLADLSTNLDKGSSTQTSSVVPQKQSNSEEETRTTVVQKKKKTIMVFPQQTSNYSRGATGSSERQGLLGGGSSVPQYEGNKSFETHENVGQNSPLKHHKLENTYHDKSDCGEALKGLKSPFHYEHVTPQSGNSALNSGSKVSQATVVGDSSYFIQNGLQTMKEKRSSDSSNGCSNVEVRNINIESENKKSRDQSAHDSGYSSSATDASSSKSQSPQTGDREAIGVYTSSNQASAAKSSTSAKSSGGGSLGFLHQTSQQFLQNAVNSSRQRHGIIYLDDNMNSVSSANVSEFTRTVPPSAPSSKPTDTRDPCAMPTYDWVISRIRELRNSSDRIMGSSGDPAVSFRKGKAWEMESLPPTISSDVSTSFHSGMVSSETNRTKDTQSGSGEHKYVHQDSPRVGEEPDPDHSRSILNHRSSRSVKRQQDSSIRSKSETREYTPRNSNRSRNDPFSNRGHRNALWIQERSVHVDDANTNKHDSPSTNQTRHTPLRSEKSRRVEGNLDLTKDLDEAMKTLQTWGDRIQALTYLYQDHQHVRPSNTLTNVNVSVSSSNRNPSVDFRPHHQNQTTTSTPKRSRSLTREPSDGTKLFIDEPVSRSKGQIEADANVNNSANVYSPNRYAQDTSLPLQSSSKPRPVNRSNSLGGYDSDSAIHYKPTPGKLPIGNAESWMQNPGAVPSQESEYWNRITGLRSPGEKSPRDMHSSNESLPNGGTTPKFPVGPKGYANMVKTCIAVVGKPPHGPDEQLPLSPTREKPGDDDFLGTSFPIYPEPARKLDTSVRPVQESPLQVRRLEPAQVQLQEVPVDSRPTHPVQGQIDRVPNRVPQYAESQARTPVSREKKKPLPQNENIDVESLEALLESVTPVEARGGVPDRPISPGSYPDMGVREGYGPQYPSQPHKPREPEIHYAEVQIEPNRNKQQQRSTPVEPVRYAQVQPTNRSPTRQETRPHLADSQYPQVSQHPQTMPSYTSSPYATVPSQPTQTTQQGQVPVTSSQQPQHPVVEMVSKTHISPAKVVLHDLPMLQTGEQKTPNQRVPIDAQVVVENRQPVVSNSSVNERHRELSPQQNSPTHSYPIQQNHPPTSGGYQSQTVPTSGSHGYPSVQNQPLFSQGYPSQQTQPSVSQGYPFQQTQPSVSQGYPSQHPSSPSRSQGAQQIVPQYLQQPQRAVIEHSLPQQERSILPQYTQHEPTMLEHVSPQQVQQQQVPPQQVQQQHASPQHVPQQHVPSQVQQQHVSPQHVQHQHVPSHIHQQHVSPQHVQQQHVPQHAQPQQQGVPQKAVHTQEIHQQQLQQYQHPQIKHLHEQSPSSGDLPSISFSEATPPPKHLDQLESPIFQQRMGGEESASQVPNLQNLEVGNAPPPMYPTYSDRQKGRPQPLYPTFSDRHRKGHARIDDVFAGAPNGNYKTLYDNRGAANRGRGSSGSDGSAVSPGTTSPVRQAVSPAGPSPSPSGRSTPSNFYLMPYTSPYGSNSSLADPNKEHVRFVKDLSSWWYKPHISREEAISMLRDKQPGVFVVRDSNSFPGAFGLAIKVAQPPANAPPKKGGDPTNELIRHFLIEPNTRGVRLKGCTNEPIFGSLSALIYQHTLTQLALPCKLVLPDTDPAGVDSPDVIDPKSAAALLQQGAACNVLYLQCVDMESLTGPSAVREAITRVVNQKEKPKGVKVHFKVSLKGVTITDSARKLFFRKHFPVESILYCGMDPGSRKFPRMEGQDDPDAKCFGFVSRKPGSLTDNQCMVFAEYETEQPASAIVSFVTKVLLGSKQMKSP